MSLKEKIQFLNQCKNNMAKFNFYLDMSDSTVSCRPSLVLKQYYKWCLKFHFNEANHIENFKDYFTRVIEKLDYKVISNMDYDDLRQITDSYYSLAEIYLSENNIDKAREFFKKVIDVMEEFLKSGNRFQTQEVQEKNGLSLFEILMWARKSYGDLLTPEEALPLYESIIGEEEILYIQKHYSIYLACRELGFIEKCNDAVRALIKMQSDYENINKDSVEFFISVQDYDDAIEISSEEYDKDHTSHWINMINMICAKAEELSEQCVRKVLGFADQLLSDLKITEWSTLMYSVYEASREYQPQSVIVLDYIKSILSKIDYVGSDFVNCSNAVLVIDRIYEDIRLQKAEKEYLRSYEFDFSFFLMNVSVQNGDFTRGVESSSKVLSLINVNKENKKLQSYADRCMKESFKNVELKQYDLEQYPWEYLYGDIDSICDQYGDVKKISMKTKMSSSLNKIIIGISALENIQLEEMINSLSGRKVFNEKKDLVFVCNNQVSIPENDGFNYDYDVVCEKGIIKNDNAVILTTKKASLLGLSDRNIVLVNGHDELRDIDITYITHILSNHENTVVTIIVDKKSDSYSESALTYNVTVAESIIRCGCAVIDISESDSENVLDRIIGDCLTNVIQNKFYSFKSNIDGKILEIHDDIKEHTEEYKRQRYILSEAKSEYGNLLEDLEGNRKEFSNKIDKDIEFLGNYADEKLAVIIPDLIEKKFPDIDDLDDRSDLKERAEEIFSKAIETWCKKHVYDMLLEQFEVFISRYTNIYSYHQKTIEKLNDNRGRVIEAYDEFKTLASVVKNTPVEEVIKSFLESYHTALDAVDYNVSVVPNQNFIVAVTGGIKGMFMKSEEKAESLRVSIKGQVYENRVNIKEQLVSNIKEQLGELSNMLHKTVSDIFDEVKKVMDTDLSYVSKAITDMDSHENERAAVNQKLEENIKLLQTELMKYDMQVSHNMVYSNNFCYRLD